MNESKSIILCNCKTKCTFYPFLLPILFMFIRYFHDKMIEESEPELSYKILKYNLPYLFYLYLPKILSIVFIPIIKWKLKNESPTQAQNISFRNYHIFTQNQNKRKIFLFFYIISLLEVIQDTGDFLLYYFQRIGKMGWLIEKKTGYILFVPIFSYFLLDKLLYRHHILALIIGLMGAFIINFCRFYLDFAEIDQFKFHLLNAFFSSLFSLALVLIKYIMSKYLILSPYVFLFYDGIFCIINSFICILIEWPIVVNIPDPNQQLKGENDNYLKNNFLEIFTLFQDQNRKFFIYFFLSFVLSFFYYIINVLTIYNFSPYLIIILEACLPIDNDIVPLFWGDYIENKDDKLKRTYIQLSGYVIIFFSALILDEIIILNFCGLNNNTFSKISLRAEDDLNTTELRLFEQEENDDDNHTGSITENNIDNNAEEENENRAELKIN